MSLFSSGVDAQAVSVAAIHAVVEIRQVASRFMLLKQWNIEFDGVTASNTPVRVELIQGTGTASSGGGAGTVNPMRALQPAAAATSVLLVTTENGTVTVLEFHRVPPTSGILIQYPLGEEPFQVGAASNTNILAVRAFAAQAVNATCTMEWEE
jgi:hypothetical protein